MHADQSNVRADVFPTRVDGSSLHACEANACVDASILRVDVIALRVEVAAVHVALTSVRVDYAFACFALWIFWAGLRLGRPASSRARYR